ncbi:helitron helicase-like domain-containing protein [Artemisia annua]|uniref:Helitron helicase-like domain-containing protein n=1 Tax=Artemisia annua TaxID=35608 RepID=A0A2U1MTU1_ARTAN|nr:helitron helicase-like domain-containing protein [Artemisia annua]
MTSLGATVDDTINNGRGLYVFKVAGQIYHSIGKMCPDQGVRPRFLQLYIYDTDNEVRNRLEHFTSNGQNPLRQDIVEGLIEILDHHNALVQLFRIARDKLQDMELPEFKVRLFNVVGSAQHELPTADDIGAIVFDSGPETEPEFDIIVEVHSVAKVVRRTSALEHGGASGVASTSSNTRMFVGYCRPMEDVDIMNLKAGDLGKPLDLKVYRKWISKNIPDPSPTGICFMLLDKKGGAIQATGQLPDMRQLDMRLQLDGCYRIQGYGCKRTDNWQRTLDNKVTLLFGRYTQAAPIQDEGFPQHYFNFAAYNEVCRRADTREPILTGVIQLSSTPATAIYINPEVPEADHIEQAYNELLGSAPSILLQQVQRSDVEEQQPAQVMTLAMIMEAAGHNITQHFTTDAVIIKIDESRGWYFNRCRGCGNPIEEHMPHRHCQEPGTQPVQNYRATLADVTGSIVVACYIPAAHSLVPNIAEVLSYVPDRDPYTLPPIIKDLENTKRRFRIHVGKGSRRGYPNFILDHAADTPTPLFDEPPASPGEASSSTPTRHVTTQEEPAEITPGTSSPPPIVPTPAHTILRITTAPVESTVEEAETSHEAERVPARRELFRESDEQETNESSKKSRHE